MNGILFCAFALLGQEGTPETKAAEPTTPSWFVMKMLQGTHLGTTLDANRIEISGWTDISYTASSVGQSNFPLGFNYRANEFLLQQNWLRIDRPVDKDSAAPSWGFRSDTILPGSDYRFTIARGLFSGQSHLYGIDPIQFYGEAYLPGVAKGMSVKVGRFFSQIGTESNDAPSNVLWSHSYLFIYDPFTHSGILTTTKLDSVWSVQAGLVMGSDVFIDPSASPTFIGSVKWEASDKKNTLLVSTIIGNGRYNQIHQFNNVNVFDLVYTHQFNDKLSYTLDALFGYQTNVPELGTVNWFGFANYLTQQFSDKLSGTARLEFFDDAQGQRTGFAGLYTTLTAGLTYRFRKDVILRPEVRYDYNGESAPFQGRHGLFTAGADLIVRW